MDSSSYLSLISVTSRLSSSNSFQNSSGNLIPGFGNLQENLLLNIFCNLNEREISLHVLPVCRHWKKIGLSPELWKCLEFTDNKLPSEDICRLLRQAPLLESLKLLNQIDIKTIIRQLCRSNHHVKSITIRFCSNNNEKVPERVLRYLLSSCKDLQILDLKGTQFTANNFYQQLAFVPKLKSIDLSLNKHIKVQDILTLGVNCRKLEQFKLLEYGDRNCQLSDSDSTFLFTSLSRTLKTLKFDATGLGNVSIEAILNCTKLQYLCLDNATSLCGKTFQNLWKSLPNLTKLKIRKATQLKSEDFQHLFTVGKCTMKNLNTLDIGGCWKLTDSGLDAIAKCCRKNLTKLYLQGCKNVTSLGSVIFYCPNIVQLNISHCYKLHANSLNDIPIRMKLLKTVVIDERRDIAYALRQIILTKALKIYVSLSEYNKSKIVVLPSN